MNAKLGRNDPCACGSGKKFKKCCAQQDIAAPGATGATGATGAIGSSAAPGGSAAPRHISAVPRRAAAAPDLAPLFALFKSGRHADLEAAAAALLERHADSGALWKLYGVSLWMQGKDALHAMATAAQLLPDDAEAHGNLGNVLRAHRRLDEAEASHRRAIAVKSDYAEAHNNLGSVLRDLGRFEEAVASYRRALAIKPDFAMAHDNLGLALQSLGRFDQALSSHRRALVMNPEFAVAHAHLGDALRGLGRYEEAVASYGRSLLMKPSFGEAHGHLGNALLNLGRLDEAVASCRRALEINPADAEAQIDLGNALLRLARPEEAAASYRRALAIKPDSADAHNNLGSVLRDLGKLEEAMASFRRALALEPDYAEVHNNLGNAFLDSGQIEDAAQSYRRAIDLKPDYAKAHSNLGSAYRELGLLEEAASSYRQALAYKPDAAEVLANLGAILRVQGRWDEAQASCSRAMDINPASPKVLISLAELHADKGRFPEALDLYQRAIALEPNSPYALAGVARVRKMTAGDTAWIEQAERIATMPLLPRDEVNLRYAMGKYYDDVRNFEPAFCNYRRANELKKAARAPHDRSAVSQAFESIRRIHGLEWVNQARPLANPSPRPIFIVGMPRSGTSLAEQILASHPAVFGGGELRFWIDAQARIGSLDIQADGVDPFLVQLADDYLRLLAELSADAARVVDKLPGNFLRVGLIRAVFPNARIIHMRRSPIDTCLSIYFNDFQRVHTYTNDLEDLAHYYREYLRLMDHWRTILPPDALLDVPYEGLVAEQEMWSRKMIDFIGLPWDAACIDFHETARSVNTFSRWQVRQKITKTSVERWRNYAQFLGPLLPLNESAPPPS
jgi:tetratricopeptide (TPR) repeat protein